MRDQLGRVLCYHTWMEVFEDLGIGPALLPVRLD